MADKEAAKEDPGRQQKVAKYTYGKASAAKKIINGYTVAKSYDAKAKITGYTGHPSKLKIPAKLDGKRVDEIGERAFQGNLWIVSLTIPEGVTRIGDYAFEKCENLKPSFGTVTPEFGLGVFSYGDVRKMSGVELRLDAGASFSEGTFYKSEYDGISLLDDGDGSYQLVEGSLLADGGETLLKYFPKAYDQKNDSFQETPEAQEGLYHMPEGVTKIATYIILELK